MSRVFSILAAVVALAVSAAPAYAVTSNTATTQRSTHHDTGQVGVMLQHGDFASILYNGHAGLG